MHFKAFLKSIQIYNPGVIFWDIPKYQGNATTAWTEVYVLIFTPWRFGLACPLAPVTHLTGQSDARAILGNTW